jgi:uncharacterized protein with PIN domain
MNDKFILIRFYEELNDFLKPELRKKDFRHIFFGNPTIKDTIESLGVPHPEVDLILVNGKSVDFSYRINYGDRISVYPEFELLDITPVNHLRPEPLRNPKFILDVHLGKLTAKLRMLGFDSLYSNNYSDPEIITIAIDEKRIILTHDTGILKNSVVDRGYWVRSLQPQTQLFEVVQKFDLTGKMKPFTLCMECNGKIQAFDKNRIKEKIPKRTMQFYDEFFICEICGKVYWKGSHYQNMLETIDKLKDSNA